MRKLYSLLFIVTLLSLVGCQKDNTDELQNAKATVSLSSEGESGFESTSASFDLNVENIESFTYKLHEGEISKPTDGLLIYADAKEIVEVESDGNIPYVVYGLEGDTEYTVEFSFKVRGESKYVVKPVTFTTANYDDRYIQIISADMNSMKFVINMPEGVKYRYALVDRSTYELSRMNYAWDDMTFVRYGVKADGRKEVSLHNGDITGQDLDGVNLTQVIAPGMSFVLLVTECDENYTPLYEQVNYEQVNSDTRSVKPNLANYTEECSDSNIKIKGIYAKQYFTTQDPLPAEGEVKVDIQTTERSASISFTPSEEVVRYGYAIWTESEIEVIRSLVGEDGLITALQNEFTPQTEASQLNFSIKMGVNYIVSMIHISDEAEQTRTTTFIPFTATASTKPSVVIEVTPVENAVTEDGAVNPYAVAFNIKAPNKDCKHIAMAVDYTRSFVTQANGMEGTRDENIKNIVLSYGYELREADDMSIFDDINSDEGLYVDFDSFEDTESMLAVVAFNDDEKGYLSYCTSRSAVEPAKTPVTSEEFEMMDGEWTTTYKYHVAWEDLTADPRENTFKMTITSDPAFDAPETFDSSNPRYGAIYDYYVSRGTLLGQSNPQDYATKQIQIDFEDFKKIAARFKAKYEAQNRKIVFGFVLDEDTGITNHSAWELFCDLNYSTYDVEQLFYDYGPKMFVEVMNDENGEKVIKLVNDPAIVAPFFSYYGSVHSISGMSKTAWEDYGYSEFTTLFYSDSTVVEVDDEDNISLSSVTDEYGNNDFYLSTSYNLMGADFPLTYGYDNLHLTRGYDKSAVASSTPISAPMVSRQSNPVPYRNGSRFKRMYMPNSER